MGSQTASALPYPTGTDRVMDGDNAIQALAENLTPSVWTNIPLASGIVGMASRMPAWRTHGDGTVELRGGFQLQGGGNFTTSTVDLGTLPVGARPQGQDAYIYSTGAGSAGAAGRIVCNDDGRVQGAVSVANSTMYINGIRFPGGPHYRA